MSGWNGRPAAYQEGTELGTGDVHFSMALDAGGKTRVVLNAGAAQGELETWRETFYRILRSLRIDQDLTGP